MLNMFQASVAYEEGCYSRSVDIRDFGDARYRRSML